MKDELVILVPGTEGAAQTSFAGLKPLIGRDYEVQLFDFDSLEGLDPEENFSRYVDQLLHLIEETPHARVHLLGYSLGAHIALNAAVDNQKVTSLCLVGGWLKTDAFQRERHDLWIRLYHTSPELAGRLSLLLQHSSTYRAFLAEQQTASALVAKVPDDEIYRRVLVNRILDSTRSAKRIRTPTLVISGTFDMKVSMGLSLELHGALENSSFMRINSGHALLVERLGQVYGAFDDFLKGEMQPGELSKSLVP